MTLENVLTVAALLVISVIAAGAILATLSRVFDRAERAREQRPPAGNNAVFIFENGMLSDPQDRAKRLIRQYPMAETDLEAIVSHLSHGFPDLPDKLEDLGSENSIRIAGIVPGDVIRVETWDGILRIEVCDHRKADDPIDLMERDSLEDELDALRSIAEDAPQLIWKVDGLGQLVWANKAYLEICDKTHTARDGEDPRWPSRGVFTDLQPLPDDRDRIVQRVPVQLVNAAEPLWFEVTTVRRGASVVHFGVDATGIIAAEAGRQTFIQTLTKAFAHLSIGLAVFDRERRLTLFNPAFLELTGLPVTFLSGRPRVDTVLDRLRDNNRLPEPRNYASWREQITALEAAAVEGSYCENWTLPGGQTYRVSGKPHPDGAIAFMFEDISNEIMLARNFRSELDTAQAVIDTLEEAVAVFSPNGTLTTTNLAYHRLWGRAGDAARPTPDRELAVSSPLSDARLHEELARWQELCAPSPFWAQLSGFSNGHVERDPPAETVRLKDGRAMICRMAPMGGGGLMVGFRLILQGELQGELQGDEKSASVGGKIKTVRPARSGGAQAAG